MNAEEFKKAWTSTNDNLNPIDLIRLKGLGLSKEIIHFLTAVGLPNNAAPFLSFSQNTDDIHYGIQKLNTVFDILEPEYSKYIIIGTCNDGDPIVINIEKNYQIEFLDHENYFSARPFNTDLNSLANCLIIYRNFISKVNQNGENAYINSEFTDEQYEELKGHLYNADPKVLGNDDFWSEQLKIELTLREESENEK